MNNPYTSSLSQRVDANGKSHWAADIGRCVFLVLIWLVVSYAVFLPSSKMLTKDSALIATSPFIPIGLLAAAIAGETIWAMLLTLLTGPMVVGVIVSVLGVRKRRAWIAAISMGILYGLFLRLFYMMYDIA